MTTSSPEATVPGSFRPGSSKNSSNTSHWERSPFEKLFAPREEERAVTLVLPRFYMTDFFSARDTSMLHEHGVTHVLTVMERTPNWPETTRSRLKTMHVEVQDKGEQNLGRHLKDTTRFIKQALEESENNVVLVHCFAGVSRSATVVAAFLSATKGMDANEAISFLKEKRSVISPNYGFRKQLKEYVCQNKGVFGSTLPRG